VFLDTGSDDGTDRRPHRGIHHRSDTSADKIGMMMALSVRPSARGRLSLEAGQVWSQRSSMEHLVLESEPQSKQLLIARALYELNDETAFVSSARFWVQGISFGTDSEQDQIAGFSYADARSLRSTAGTDLVVPLHDALSAHVGGQGAVERVSAPFIHPNVSGEIRPSYGFYGGLKAMPSDTLDLLVTGRGDLSPIAADLKYSYRASAVYHRDTWGLRLTGASAFRTPTYVEAAGRFVDPSSGLILLEGTDSIGSPRNTSLELGAHFSPHSRLVVSSTAYVSRLSNLMVEDFESVVRRSFHNDPGARSFLGGEFEATWRVSDALSVLPSFSVLHWLEASERIDTNVGVPSQNSTYLGGLRVLGLFANETWGYGLGVSVVSPRSYNVRAGIPPLVLDEELPTTARLTATLEHQLFPLPSVWASLRLGASVPGNTAESPLPLATPPGQSAILGIELRRE